MLTTEVDDPTAVTAAGDGRVVIAERTGRIQVLRRDGTLVEAGRVPVASAPCADCAEPLPEEGGLHGLALAPGFTESGRIYAYYSVPQTVAISGSTPPIRGDIPAATVAAMSLAGTDEIYLLGGVQAVSALAIGTETIGNVDLIAGPGNAYVAEAKRQLFGEVGIDLFAGPTEILVIADDTADPFVVAVDLLSQAEHGPDSPAVLITTSAELGRQVIAHIDELLPGMPTRDFAEPAWRDHGEVVVVNTVEEAFAVADGYASEHVEVLTENPRQALDAMHNYGALFLGEGTCASYGDKVIGTNHVLPTRGAARYTGGLWVGKYLKTVTYQEVTDPASSARLGEICGRASRVELFEGHARSGDIRAAIHGDATPSWAAGHSVRSRS
ncbi:MAG: histidinol dehydrogenase [Actinophytocola sp.]|nr:histidinol dehydrogenase [Actinophytocola sp.]